MECPICFVKFYTDCSYWGHKSTCGNSRNSVPLLLNSPPKTFADEAAIIEDDFDTNIEAEFNQEVIDDDESSCVYPVNQQYKLFQDALVDSLKEKRKDMPSVKKSDGVYARANRRIYNRFIKFTAPRTQFSEDDNTELIVMIKAISRINGDEIPLPSRYLIEFSFVNVVSVLCTMVKR